MSSIILDISLGKENKETNFTESESEIGPSEEEILQIKNRKNLKPVVYSRKKVIGRSKDHSMIQVHGQPKALGDGSLNASGTPSLFIPIPITDLSVPSVPELESKTELVPTVLAQNHDLNLPIALRKGTRACTKHPMAKYISYDTLFENYRAFTTNISKLVIPRNIQETLDEPSWKLAVFEEMNALKKMKLGRL